MTTVSELELIQGITPAAHIKQAPQNRFIGSLAGHITCTEGVEDMSQLVSPYEPTPPATLQGALEVSGDR